jgi:hypothetical protein
VLMVMLMFQKTVGTSCHPKKSIVRVKSSLFVLICSKNFCIRPIKGQGFSLSTDFKCERTKLHQLELC